MQSNNSRKFITKQVGCGVGT